MARFLGGGSKWTRNSTLGRSPAGPQQHPFRCVGLIILLARASLWSGTLLHTLGKHLDGMGVAVNMTSDPRSYVLVIQCVPAPNQNARVGTEPAPRS